MNSKKTTTIAPMVFAAVFSVMASGVILFADEQHSQTKSDDYFASPTVLYEDTEFREMVYEAIRAKPGIVFEAISAVRAQEEAVRAAERQEILKKIEPMLLSDINAPVIGNPDGDVTVVEFYDYNCPYCKKVSPEVKKLIETDDNVRVVMREMPILGASSVEATRVALASHGQGMFKEVHTALMENKDRLKEGDALEVARNLGLNMALLEQDMMNEDIQRHIDLTTEFARFLGINGTPAFVIGSEIIPGAASYDQLKVLIEAAREAEAE